MAYTINFYQNGKSIDYAPAADVAAGSIVVLKGQVGITKLDIAAGVKGALAIEGIFAVPKKNELLLPDCLSGSMQMATPRSVHQAAACNTDWRRCTGF
jgi:predicted RecA/RadA family phage recombinase